MNEFTLNWPGIYWLERNTLFADEIVDGDTESRHRLNCEFNRIDPTINDIYKKLHNGAIHPSASCSLIEVAADYRAKKWYLELFNELTQTRNTIR